MCNGVGFFGGGAGLIFWLSHKASIQVELFLRLAILRVVPVLFLFIWEIVCYQTQVCFYDSLTLYGLERLMFSKSQRVWNITIWQVGVSGCLFFCLNELKRSHTKMEFPGSTFTKFLREHLLLQSVANLLSKISVWYQQ